MNIHWFGEQMGLQVCAEIVSEGFPFVLLMLWSFSQLSFHLGGVWGNLCPDKTLRSEQRVE